jgi:hypothetical protein
MPEQAVADPMLASIVSREWAAALVVDVQNDLRLCARASWHASAESRGRRWLAALFLSHPKGANQPELTVCWFSQCIIMHSSIAVPIRFAYT